MLLNAYGGCASCGQSAEGDGKLQGKVEKGEEIFIPLSEEFSKNVGSIDVGGVIFK